jgi:hypothetical protein
MRRAQRVLVATGLAVALFPGGPVPRSAPVGHYAAPGGTATGDGSQGRPWDLATALAGGRGAVQPGDTIWLRGGTYPGKFAATLTGTSAAPIVVRQYPGERATLDGTLRVDGAYAIYWGFELMQSNPVANGNDALDTYGPNCAFVNLIVHDAGKQGISFWESSGRSELYGSIFYNNGTHEGLDHGIYAANEAGEKWIVDNVVFDNLAYGIHVYAGSRHPLLSNVHVRGNVAFNTGAISARSERGANLLIGGDLPTEHMTADSNLLYFPGTTGLNLRLGLPRGDNRDVAVRGNYVVGGQVALFMQGWREAEVRDNWLAGAIDLVDLRTASFASHAWRWSGNTYYRDPTARAWRYQGSESDLPSWEAAAGLMHTGTATASLPTMAQVFVRPNRYEPGRALIVIYNWGHDKAVSVKLSGVLRVGARYEIRNVENLFGQPLVSGTYGGGAIAIPLGAVAPPLPIGRRGPVPSAAGPDFGVFLLTSRRS